MRIALVFGASGSIGQAICKRFQGQGNHVIGVSRNPAQAQAFGWVTWGEDEAKFLQELNAKLLGSKIDSVVWAQGMNFNDEISTFDANKHLEMYEANVLFILSSLQALMNGELLVKDAKLCVISSIWQNIARQAKLSYCVTKSALQGLVQSLAVDLGKQGTLINAVLPGALDTPMTRSNLNSAQIQRLESAAPLQTLPSLEDVAGLVDYLCSPSNTGITGQFIAADRGFSYARIL